MTVIRSQNKDVFGGFSTIHLSSSGFEKDDSFAFIFTLKSPFGISSTKYPIRERAKGFDVCQKPTNRPTFGSIQNEESDIFLHSTFNVVGSRICFLRTYKDTTGRDGITFIGDFYFHWDDIGVFTQI